MHSNPCRVASQSRLACQHQLFEIQIPGFSMVSWIPRQRSTEQPASSEYSELAFRGSDHGDASVRLDTGQSSTISAQSKPVPEFESSLISVLKRMDGRLETLEKQPIVAPPANNPRQHVKEEIPRPSGPLPGTIFCRTNLTEELKIYDKRTELLKKWPPGSAIEILTEMPPLSSDSTWSYCKSIYL